MKAKFLVGIILIVAMLGSSVLFFFGCDTVKSNTISYTISFDSMGGSQVKSIRVAAGGKAEAPEYCVKKGYTLTGWYTSKTEMNLDTRWAFLGYTVTRDMTLYAGWMQNIYTVEYDGNGGVGTSIPIPAVYDESFEALANIFTLNGYTFLGWNTKADGNGTAYSAGQSIKNLTDKDGENVKLYAQWTGNKYTVTFDKRSGTGGSDTVTATYNSNMPAATAPTRYGYDFTGYYDQTSGGTQYYTATMTSVLSWNKTWNTTLYAQWTANKYTVTFDKRSGTGGSDAVTATYGYAMPSATAPKRTDYIFMGYYDQVSGGTQYYTATMATARTWDKAEDTMLYAQWMASKYTVTFDTQGGTGGSDTVTATYGSSMPSATAPTKIGYDFAGYYDQTSGGTQYYTATMASARTWDKAEDTTLYAQWTVSKRSVTFDKQGGTGGTDTVTATYGSNMPSATAPAMNGYNFEGYYDQVSGGTQYYTETMASTRTWDKMENTTLYARWTELMFEFVSAGDYHSLGIDTDGSLWAWGDNDRGQLGDGTTSGRYLLVKVRGDIRFRSVSAGSEHSLGIDTDGNLWAWGYNGYGQLGDGTFAIKSTPVQVSSGTKFQSISAGDEHSLGIDADGNLWAWGDNFYDQLGDGSGSRKTTPVKVSSGTKFQSISAGTAHSLGIDTDGNLWAWGGNSDGQLGDGTTARKTTPVQVSSGTKFRSISAGYYHSLGIDTDGNLWTWGNNNSGQLGDGTTASKTTPVQVSSGTKFRSISAGAAYSLGIDTDGNLWTWGNNEYGQLGDGTTTRKTTPVQVSSGTKFQSISAGGAHSLGVDTNENLWVWGYNARRQLGDGTTVNKTTPVKIP